MILIFLSQNLFLVQNTVYVSEGKYVNHKVHILAPNNGVARKELYLRTSRENLKSLPSITFKMGATLKGKNLLP